MAYAGDDANHKTEKRNEDTENVVLAAIQTLRVEISAIKTDVNKLRENRSPSQLDNRRRPQRKKCTLDKIEFCDHCFKCGSSEHFARVCRQSNTSRHQ